MPAMWGKIRIIIYIGDNEGLGAEPPEARKIFNILPKTQL